MIEVLCAIVSTIMLTLAMVWQPTTGQCPIGWYLPEGVRTDDNGYWPRGSFACQRPPIGGDTDVLTGKNTAIEQPGTLRGRIHCTGGTREIVVDERTVGCQRR